MCLQLYAELRTSEEWVRGHVGDTAGLSHRQLVLRLLCESQGVVLCVVHLHRCDPACGAAAFADGNRIPPVPASAATSVVPLLLSELEFCTQLMDVYPGHEALWVHRRFVVGALMYVAAAPSDSADGREGLGAEGLLESEVCWAANAKSTVLDAAHVPDSSVCGTTTGGLGRVYCDVVQAARYSAWLHLTFGAVLVTDNACTDSARLRCVVDLCAIPDSRRK
jgi:protein prenyltransferase alpha subunit repeat-containing protein